MRIKNARPRDPAVEAYLASKAGTPGEACRWLVDLCRATVPGSLEAIYHGVPMFCTPDGALFAYVATHTRHANLGFVEGARLEDPDGLLEGTGKGMRHVKVAAPNAVPRAKLARLLKAAAKRARA